MLQPSELREPGDHPVEAPVYCVLTRFGLRGARFLPATYRDFRRVAAGAARADVPGLLRFAFLVENPSTCYSLSLWSEPPLFSAAVPEHVQAARGVFERLNFSPEAGPELWSTQWRLASVTNNLNWDGLDLRSVIAPSAEAG